MHKLMYLSTHPLPVKQLLESSQCYWHTGMPSQGAIMESFQDSDSERGTAGQPQPLLIPNQPCL
uniref:Uncharacterized protein n=1 Tax=Triticum urartu TaxID=4572 RepID=A0A8R7Q004_TRIUA